MSENNIPTSHSSASGDDWAKDAILEVLRANMAELRRGRRWRFAFKAVSALIFLSMAITFASAWWGYYEQVSQPHAALIRIEGPISAQADANADRIVSGLRKAFESAMVRAVILAINSPGGSPVQAEIIHDEIIRLKQKAPDKPVVAAISDMGASAAYYIAAAADRIYASRASVVGSIGVRLDSFGFTEAMRKLGIERRLYVSGEYKGVLDMFSEPEPAAIARIQDTLDQVHQQFIEVVKKGRGDRLKNDPALFSGLFWTGEEAVEMGLVDGISDRREVVEDILGLAREVNYTPPVDLLRKIGAQTSAVLKLVESAIFLSQGKAFEFQ